MTVPSEAAPALIALLPEQDHAEQLVVLGQELGGQSGAAIAGLGEVLQPVAVERHHAGFGDGEKRGEEE